MRMDEKEGGGGGETGNDDQTKVKINYEKV